MTRRTLMAGAGLTLALAAPAGAQAATAAGGHTDLSLASKAAKALKAAGVKVTPVGTKAVDGVIPFPVTGSSSTKIMHTGGLKLSRGGRSLTLSNFTIVLKKGAPVRIDAKAGSAKVTAFTLDARKTKTTTAGLDTKVGPVTVKLSGVAAGAIKQRLGVALPGGYTMGKATVVLQSAATAVTLDAGTAKVLMQLGVAVAPEAPAVADSTIQFPVTNTGGVISTKAPITHSGGLVFSGAGKTLTVGDFTIDPVAGVLYAERSPVGRLPLFGVDLSGATVTTPGVQAVVSGAKLALTADAAGALNATFGVTAFTAGLAIGTADVVGLAG
ncbi:MAG: hypothetical protein J7513_03320 [Solirubrobacteraceae bacterium]|nr:hypothetical protein [Solirubrobacteraceae bacterium]